MRLATITNWAYGATVFLSLASAATMLLASSAQDYERTAVEQRYQMDQAASKEGEDVTTISDKAREYVITGETASLAAYHSEASGLQSIEARLQHMKDRGAGPDELSSLANAMK